MATAKQSRPTYEMTLTAEEANYLMNILQNDLTGNRDEKSEINRQSIFDALRTAIPSHGVR